MYHELIRTNCNYLTVESKHAAGIIVTSDVLLYSEMLGIQIMYFHMFLNEHTRFSIIMVFEFHQSFFCSHTYT